jgi:hypothetical protein
VAHTYHFNYVGSINRIVVQAGLGKSGTLTQKYLKQKGWGCGSSGRAPAYLVQDPEFTPNTTKKERKKKIT